MDGCGEGHDEGTSYDSVGALVGFLDGERDVVGSAEGDAEGV